jgi:hypothetical protein
LRTPARSRRTAAQPLARTRARCRRSRVQLLVEPQPDAGRARDELDRAVVVRRAEPARDDAEVGAQPSRAPPRARPRGRRRSTIRAGSIPRRSSSAARNGPFRSRRSPRTSSLPVTTTNARGAVKRPGGCRAA